MKHYFILILLLLTGCLVEQEIVVEQIIPEYEEVSEESEETINKLHWENLPVKYNIINEKVCGSYQSNKIKRAFDKIENATNKVVQFEKVDSGANIEISCTFIEDCYKKTVEITDDYILKSESICSFNRGIAFTKFLGNKIQSAHIEFVGLAGFSETTGRGASGFYIGSCGHENTEIHEILHTFGYNHLQGPASIMYFREDGVGYTLHKDDECKGSKKEIDQEIIDDSLDTYG